jgi:hypothetical protein
MPLPHGQLRQAAPAHQGGEGQVEPVHAAPVLAQIGDQWQARLRQLAPADFGAALLH